ncbi:DUF1302 domain-containing protein [Acinetobacter bohemicus]|uniref:DUF1302 domain-containing protein n=1 Tax=Acinetobacter sp. S4397-1 TaxID=2972915 RepID=UPI00209B58F9|nr:DUF1302 domain-containing protein [Acinetobacter sp. S4397-1]MCO8045707.1 DUF1302 domain-containing protein [Acinetobacter sp. S4397-1]MDM1780447.1 DUF1302 domain-containing protein [Acinetobacter indicus]
MVNQSIYFNRKGSSRSRKQYIGIMSGILVITPHTSAGSFELNENWKLSTETYLSLGGSWSTQSADRNLLYKPDANHIGKAGNSLDINADDGRMNFSKNDAISQIIKGFTQVKVDGRHQGAVLSTKYWYDHAYETGHGDLKAFDDSAWPRLAKFKGIDLWDAYIWKNFTFDNDQDLNIKIGKQALNWGKSRFLLNGLNSVNAFDFAAMNSPGGEFRENIIPAEMFSFSTQLNAKLKVEGFYQFKFRPTVADGCGTFFEVSDVLPKNCGPMLIASGDKLSETALNNQTYIPRTSDRMPKDSGQFGLALKQNIPVLNNAELGIYYANFHNRIANFDATTVKGYGPENFDTAAFFAVYPENIEMYGLSLSTTVGATSIYSELNHKPNQPLQLNGPDIVYFQILAKDTPFTEPGVSPELNQYIKGYVRLPVTQFSIGANHTFPDFWGGKDLKWTAEFGANHIADIANHRIGRSSAFGRSDLSTGAYNPQTKEFQCTAYGTAHLPDEAIDRMNERFCNSKDGFFSEWSLGYRLKGALNYPELLPATVITPSLMFRHDIHGYSQNFQEGQMAMSASVSATYQQKYTAELAYTNFFGSNEFSVLDDRDFASLVFKMNF